MRSVASRAYPQAIAARTSPLVHLEDVSKHYKSSRQDVAALSEVSLKIAPHAFLAVTGPSGSGKSTLMHILGCLDAPTSGRALVCGIEAAEMSDNARTDFRARHIGFVFQDYSLIPTMSALKNVELGLLKSGLTASQRREKAFAMLNAVGLSGLESRRPNALSGGQQQRVAIGRALVKEPALVLADEPTANLDSRSAMEVLELMLDLRERCETSFVFSTHDARLLSRMEDIICLRDGRIAPRKGAAA